MESLCFGLAREGPNEHLPSQAKPRMFFGHNNTSDCESLLSMHPSCQKSSGSKICPVELENVPHLYSCKILTSVSQCISYIIVQRWSQLGHTGSEQSPLGVWPPRQPLRSGRGCGRPASRPLGCLGNAPCIHMSKIPQKRAISGQIGNCTDTNWLPFWMLLTIEWNGLQPSDPVWPKGSQRSHTNHYIIIMMPPMPWPKMSEITSRYLSTIKHMYKFAFSTPLAPKAPGVVFLAALLVLALPVASLGNQAHCSDIVLPPSTCQEGLLNFCGLKENDDEWIG